MLTLCVYIERTEENNSLCQKMITLILDENAFRYLQDVLALKNLQEST